MFVRAGFADILISNEITDPVRIDRLAALAKQARIIVCVDDPANIAPLSAAAQRHKVTIEVLVELDVGARRCGMATPDAAVDLALRTADAAGLRFAGLQAYHGPAQHFRTLPERRAAIGAAIEKTRLVRDRLNALGLDCGIIGGAGTGTAPLEAASGVYNELQAGSYAFMDAAYGGIEDADGQSSTAFRHALFLLTSVMSVAAEGRAICDAGLKSQTLDSGLPAIWSRSYLSVLGCNDEHLILSDPGEVLAVNDKLRLVPGHCDPTCNLHDWYVGVRHGVVQTLWPISARGKSL